MVGRLTVALPYALRTHMLQAEEVDCYAQPVDLPADLKARPSLVRELPCVFFGRMGMNAQHACHAADNGQAKLGITDSCETGCHVGIRAV